MNQQELLTVLNGLGAVLTNGHFVYTSGKHGTSYVNKDVLYQIPHVVRQLCGELAALCYHDSIQGVVAPAVGGVVLSHLMAESLEIQRARHRLERWDVRDYVFSVYAEREEKFLAKRNPNRPMGVFFDGQQYEMEYGDELVVKVNRFVLKRGYDQVVKNRSVLIVEDVITTGGTVKKVIDAVRMVGGEVLGVAALVNRGGVSAQMLGVPKLHSLVNVDFLSYDLEACQEFGPCSQGIPINTDVGKGKQFLESKGGK